MNRTLPRRPRQAPRRRWQAPRRRRKALRRRWQAPRRCWQAAGHGKINPSARFVAGDQNNFDRGQLLFTGLNEALHIAAAAGYKNGDAGLDQEAQLSMFCKMTAGCDFRSIKLPET